MGWRLLRRIERRARVTDNYEKETEEVYELDSAEDFNAFLVAFKRRGGVVVERRGGLVFYFTIESIAIERRPPMASGKLQATATLTMALTTRGPTLVAPWELPPTAYRVSTTTLEEPASRFYPGVGDLLFPNGSADAQPLTNTAGTKLAARSTRALSLLEFSYNAPVSTFDAQRFWSAQGKINRATTTICGTVFPPRSVRLESFAATYSTETVETVDANGATTATTWKFYKIDVAILANPRSFDQLFSNVGSRVNRNGVLAQIWRWTNPATGANLYGTRAEALAANARDAEPVAENLPLDATGAAVAPIQTHRVGSLCEPIDFDALGLPEAPPSQWRADFDD